MGGAIFTFGVEYVELEKWEKEAEQIKDADGDDAKTNV